MKALLSICCAYFGFISIAEAQILKGDLFLSTGTTPLTSLAALPTSIASGVGSVSYIDNADGALVLIAPTLGFAVTDGLVLGGQLAFGGFLGEGGTTDILLTPTVRYYLLNREAIMAYGTGSYKLLGEESFLIMVGNRFRLGAGLSLPIGENILFSPELGYNMGDMPNGFDMALQFEFLLGPNRGSGTQAIGVRNRGRWLLGTRTGNIIFGGDESTGIIQISPEVMYLLSDRFALGVRLSFDRVSFKSGNFSFSQSSLSYGLNGRYYFEAAKHLDWFAELGVGRTGANAILIGVGEEQVFAFDLGIGADVWLRERIAFEFGINARLLTNDSDNSLEIGPFAGGRFLLGGN